MTFGELLVLLAAIAFIGLTVRQMKGSSRKSLPESNKLPSEQQVLFNTGSPGSAELNVCYQGQFFVVDVEVNLLLDGQPFGKGSVKTGINVTGHVPSGKHALEVRHGPRSMSYIVELPADSRYRAYLSYDRMWGNFAKEIEIQTRS
jgi:hypothetical protein